MLEITWKDISLFSTGKCFVTRKKDKFKLKKKHQFHHSSIFIRCFISRIEVGKGKKIATAFQELRNVAKGINDNIYVTIKCPRVLQEEEIMIEAMTLEILYLQPVLNLNKRGIPYSPVGSSHAVRHCRWLEIGAMER